MSAYRLNKLLRYDSNRPQSFLSPLYKGFHYKLLYQKKGLDKKLDDSEKAQIKSELSTASRLYDPLSGNLTNIAEIFNTEMPIRRMNEI